MKMRCTAATGPGPRGVVGMCVHDMTAPGIARRCPRWTVCGHSPPPSLDRGRAGRLRSPAGGPAPMQFGIFYEHQLPRPWQEDSEARLIREALAQVQLADRLGIGYPVRGANQF